MAGKPEPQLPSNPAELEVVLSTLTQPDTEKIKQATDVMIHFLKKPQAITALMMQLGVSKHPEVRQMAAVLIRRRIRKHWKALADHQAAIKKALLERLTTEPVHIIRHNVAAAVSQLAKILVPDGNWNELLTFLLACCESKEPAHRQVGMLLFRALTENIGSDLRPHFGVLQKIFMKGLKDPSDKVRVEALKAIAVLVEYIGEKAEEVAQFREVVPPMVEVTRLCVQNRDEDGAAVCFEVLDALALSPTSVLNKDIPLLVKLMIDICVTPALDVNLRDKACLFLCEIAEAQPKKLMKHNLVEEILKAGIRMACEVFEDETGDKAQLTPQRIAVEIIDSIMMNYPKALVFAPALKQSVQLANSPNKHDRKGAFVVFSVMPEGCEELMKENLVPLLEVVCKGIQDKESGVVASALIALTQFADHLQPEMADHHKIVLPAIFSTFRSTSPLVVAKACGALHVFGEHIGPEIVPYLEPLMNELQRLMTSDRSLVQEHAISAVKSTALAAKEKFAPFFPKVVDMMGQLMKQTSDKLLRLRCRATECMGSLAVAVGKDAFKPFLKDTMELATRGMDLEYFELRESTYHLFDSLAQCLQEDFLPLLVPVMTLIIATMKSNDGVDVYQKDGALDGDDRGGPELSDDSEEENEEVESRKLGFSIRTGALDEKIAAITCMSTIIMNVGKAFLPFLEKVREPLGELEEYPHNYIRRAVVECYHEILVLLHKSFPNAKKIEPGVPSELHPNSAKVLQVYIPALLLRTVEEEDKHVAAAAFDAIAVCAKNFGINAVDAHLSKLLKSVQECLKEKMPYQRPDDEEEEREAKGEGKTVVDHDDVVMDTVTDVITALAQVYGQKFEPHFRKMFDDLLKFCAPTRPAYDRSMAIGCFGEVGAELGQAMLPYLPKLIPVVLAGLADPEVAVRRNSAYLASVLSASGPPAGQFYMKIFERLPPLFEPIVSADKKTKDDSSPEFLATRDNATSTIARMLMTNAKEFGSNLPKVIELFVRGLPLKSDFQEQKYVYPALLGICAQQPALIMPHLPRLVSIIAQVLAQGAIEDQYKMGLLALATSLVKSLAKEVAAIVEKLPAEQQDTWTQALKMAASGDGK